MHKHLSSKLDVAMGVMQRVPREPGESATDISGAPISPIYAQPQSPSALVPMSALSELFCPDRLLWRDRTEAPPLQNPQQLPVSFPLLYPSLQPALISARTGQLMDSLPASTEQVLKPSPTLPCVCMQC